MWKVRWYKAVAWYHESLFAFLGSLLARQRIRHIRAAHNLFNAEEEMQEKRGEDDAQ